MLVACSGGADSLAVAAATAFTVREHGPFALRAGAVLIDHGLQPDSAQVTARAAAQCRELGLDPVLTRRVDVGRDGGPESAARDARYAALAEVAAETGAVAVLLGHTRDDQAEGVLLGLARGSGARSLAGMTSVRGLWRRPLLDLPRADTEAACAAQGITPWHDPTNTPGPQDDGPLRSRVRTRVLPVLERELGPGVSAALARTADALREDADALDALADDMCLGAVTEHDGEVLVDIAGLDGVPAALRRRVLRRAALLAGAPAAALTRAHLLAVDALLTDWHGQGPVHLPGRVAVGRGYGSLFLRGDR